MEQSPPVIFQNPNKILFFDSHLDLLSDMINQHYLGVNQPLQKRILELVNHRGAVANLYFEGNNKHQELIDSLHLIDKLISESGIKVIKNFADCDNNFDIVLAIEGLAPVETLADIDLIYQLGFRQISLTWNDKNKLGSGGEHHGGLTDFGKEVVKRFIELGGIIDISHANYQTALDILSITNSNVIASHSNSYSVYNHFRNLPDNIIKLIVEKGGIIGLTPAYFIADKNNRTIDTFIDHIDYVKELVGIHHICISTDFMYFLPDYQRPTITNLATSADLELLVDKLLERGYRSDEIRLLAYGNYLEYLRRTLK